MIDTAQERVLDHALEQLLGEREKDAELAARVAAAWEQGEQGSGLADLGTLEPSPVPAARSAWRRSARWLAAAALLGAVGWVIWQAQPRAERGPIVARVLGESPAFVLRNGDPKPKLAQLVRAGEAVWTGAGAATLQFERGGMLVLHDKTLLAFADAAELPVLMVGSIRLETAQNERAELTLGFADVDAAPGSVLEAAVELPDADTPPPGWLLARLAAAEPLERTLRLAVSRGEVALQHGDVSETLLAGDVRVLHETDRAPQTLSKEDETWLAERCAELSIGKPMYVGTATAESALDFEQALAAVGDFLRAHPAGWELVGARAEALFRDPGHMPYASHALLYLLIQDDGPRSLALARRLWLIDPESFMIDALVAFAERGAFELEREVRAVLAHRDEVKDDERLLAAAWLVGRGERAAEGVLLSLFDAEPELKEPLERIEERWLAAAALARAGEAGSEQRLTRELAAEVERALAAGDLPRAARHVLAAQFNAELRQAAALDLGTVRLRWMAHAARNAGVLQTPGAIRAALEQR